jgi:hypothetical protein
MKSSIMNVKTFHVAQATAASRNVAGNHRHEALLRVGCGAAFVAQRAHGRNRIGTFDPSRQEF